MTTAEQVLQRALDLARDASLDPETAAGDVLVEIRADAGVLEEAHRLAREGSEADPGDPLLRRAESILDAALAVGYEGQ